MTLPPEAGGPAAQGPAGTVGGGYPFALAEQLRRALARSADFEVLGSGLSVVCFRHRPPGLDGPSLDVHNEALLGAIQLSGQAFLAGTSVDGAFALRACLVNPGMTSSGLDTIVTDLRTRAARLLSGGPGGG